MTAVARQAGPGDADLSDDASDVTEPSSVVLGR
jgi:hypothetical protein